MPAASRRPSPARRSNRRPSRRRRPTSGPQRSDADEQAKGEGLMVADVRDPPPDAPRNPRLVLLPEDLPADMIPIAEAALRGLAADLRAGPLAGLAGNAEEEALARRAYLRGKIAGYGEGLVAGWDEARAVYAAAVRSVVE